MILNQKGEKIINEKEGKIIEVGQTVFANGMSKYAGLLGTVKEIRSKYDEKTENDTIEIKVDFEKPLFKDAYTVNTDSLNDVIMDMAMLSSGDVICIDEESVPIIYAYILKSKIKEKIFCKIKMFSHTKRCEAFHIFEEDLKTLEEEVSNNNLLLAEFEKCLVSSKCPRCGRKVVAGLVKDYRGQVCIGSVVNCVSCCNLIESRYWELTGGTPNDLKIMFDLLKMFSLCDSLYNNFIKQYKLTDCTKISEKKLANLLGNSYLPVIRYHQSKKVLIIKYHDGYLVLPFVENERHILSIEETKVFLREDIEEIIKEDMKRTNLLVDLLKMDYWEHSTIEKIIS